MRNSILGVVLAFGLSGIGGMTLEHAHHGSYFAACKTKGTCNACKNCRYCKPCAKDGKRCSVCRR